jgi:hypothetical protein
MKFRLVEAELFHAKRTDKQTEGQTWHDMTEETHSRFPQL